jgi:putative serine protease PepD
VNPSRSRMPFLVAGLVAALVLGAGLGAAAFSVLDDDSSTIVREVVPEAAPSGSTDGLSIASIYERTQPGVVEITTTGGPVRVGQSRSQGSGFVYDEQGHIVTNEHVVNGADAISVRFSDGSSRAAELVGSDPSTDIAVLEVDASESFLEPLAVGDSDEVSVGDGVIAMGSPFGLEGSITSGIVSALHRQIEARNGFTIFDTIQTDAALNHGNSGGPLIDMQGRVIGVNAQIESDSGGSDGVGFAIPSNTVREVVSQLVETGEAEHAYLGIVMVDTPDGVAVTGVREGGPADDAGVRAATGERTEEGARVPTGGDFVVEFDGKEITTSAELQAAVDALQPGDRVTMTVLRGDDRETLEVTLGDRPETP